MELFDHFNFMPPWIMQDGEENLTSSMHKALNMQFASNKDITSSIARLQRKCCMHALLKLEGTLCRKSLHCMQCLCIYRSSLMSTAKYVFVIAHCQCIWAMIPCISTAKPGCVAS